MAQATGNNTHISLLLMPHFPSHTLTTITNILRLTNREFGRLVFEWTLVSQAGGTVRASDNFCVETVAINAVVSRPTIICILAAYQPLAEMTTGLRHWLWEQHRRNVYLIGVESGTFVLAKAGLLKDHAVALHFEDEALFREQWPEQPVFTGLYNFDGAVATMAGATATLDFVLALVEKRCGQIIANQVARLLLYTRRDALGRPFGSVSKEDPPPQVLQRCRRLMLQHLDNPLTIPELCQQLDINVSRLRRLFKKALNVSPSHYYLRLRLTEARVMLCGTDLSVTKVGGACGFANASAFARAYKAHFGFPPSQHRIPYMGLLPSPFWPKT